MNSLVSSTRSAWAPKAYREFAEIRIYEVSATDPSRVTFLLMHSDRAVHAVVD